MAMAETSPFPAASPNLNAFRAKSRVGRRNAIPHLFSEEGKDTEDDATSAAANNNPTLMELEAKFKQMDTVPGTSAQANATATISKESPESTLKNLENTVSIFFCCRNL